MGRQDSRSFGRTGPAVVRSCGCDVLPWEDCEHTAWDANMSLEDVQQAVMSYVPEDAEEPPQKPMDDRLRSLLGRARQVARWTAEWHGKRGVIAYGVVAEIDRLLAETVGGGA